jgi:hypothetical protein
VEQYGIFDIILLRHHSLFVRNDFREEIRKGKRINRFEILSYATVLASILAFFILSGPNANLHLVVAILTLLSLLGIPFAYFF